MYNYRESTPIGSLSTMFSAEVMAILRCTELLLPKNLMRRIHICSDSRATLATLAKTNTESFLTQQSRFSVDTWASKDAKQRGSTLAKEGAIEAPLNQCTTRPFSGGKKLSKKQLELKNQAKWTACTGCRQAKMLMRYPLPSRAN